MCELTVTIKSSESTYKQKFLMYEKFYMAEDDMHIQTCINEALEKCIFAPDSIEHIKVRANLEIR